jgi:hypothetical protein
LANHFTKSIIKNLGEHFAGAMTGLAQVVEGFPSANVALKYPLLSIDFKGAPRFVPCSPYIFEQGETNDDDEDSIFSVVKWVVGQFETELQLDFWCRSKEERHQAFTELMSAMSKQMPVIGLSLPLVDYHGVIARFDLDTISYEDSEVSSQRKEWRLIVSCLAHCYAITETVENIITETESTVEVVESNTIIEES